MRKRDIFGSLHERDGGVGLLVVHVVANDRVAKGRRCFEVTGGKVSWGPFFSLLCNFLSSF